MIYIIEMEMIEVKITRFKDIPKLTKSWIVQHEYPINSHVKNNFRVGTR